jgi:ketosteroid isomerase-like protein
MPETTTDQTISEQLNELIDEREIRNVLTRYCRGIDRIDMDLVRSCYHPDAVDEHGEIGGSVEKFTEHIGKSLWRHDTTTHFIGNILVDLRGDHAFSETYCVATHRTKQPDGKVHEHVVGVRYCDRFEKRDGEWKIAHRKALMDWAKVHDGGSEWEQFDTYLHGRKDRSDPAYGF